MKEQAKKKKNENHKKMIILEIQPDIPVIYLSLSRHSFLSVRLTALVATF